MNNTKKKMNTYIKFGLIMVACLVFGGIFGAWTVFIDFSGVSGGISGGIDGVLQVIRQNMLAIMLVIVCIMLVSGELLLRKMRNLGKELEASGEEESDRIDYELEKVGAVGNIGNTILQVLAILMLAPGYSLDYIKSVESGNGRLLAAMIVFIVIFVYSGYWGVRFVKIVQKIYPEKAGDPASSKFAKQWMESCDEAEKEMIYQAGYKSYIVGMNCIQILLFAGLISHLVWNTGIMAVGLLGVLWLIMVITYHYNCVQKMKSVRS